MNPRAVACIISISGDAAFPAARADFPLDRLLKLAAVLARYLYSIARAYSRFVDQS
jgi:hypothetical protein